MTELTTSRPLADTSVRTLRFGVFEMDLRSGELRKEGMLVRLPHQPFELLAMLARRPGDVVTREEIRRVLWGDGIVVEFDQRLNTCVKQIRAALNDDADVPRYLETLPKRGYRWLMPVEAAGLGEAVVEERAVRESGQLVVGREVTRALPRGVELEDHAVALEGRAEHTLYFQRTIAGKITQVARAEGVADGLYAVTISQTQ